MRALRALAASGKVDENAAVLDLHRVGGNAVPLETWFTDAATAVKLPIMPGADNIFAIQPALAKRPADRYRSAASHAFVELARELGAEWMTR